MSLAFILQLSCILTFIVMFVSILTILIVMRFGQEWVSNIVERFMNPDKKQDDKKQRQETVSNPQPQVASSVALRQRAQNLDFPAPAGGFSSQVAPQQDSFGQSTGYGQQQQPARASLRARDEYSSFNPQATGQSQSFQATMPSLSPSRPFQSGGLQPSRQPQQGQFPPQTPQQGFPPQPQQGQFPPPQAPQQGFQPLRPQQAPQQGLPPQPQQGQFPPPQAPQQGFQPLRPQAPQPGLPPQPQQGQFPPPQAPQQGFQPLRPQQAPQQGLSPQQGQYPSPQAPQQGGLGDYRPQLNNSPRPDLRTQGQQNPYRRDSRKQEEDEGFLGGLIDDAGDLLGGF